MHHLARPAACLAVAMLAAPSVNAGAELTPYWQSRFIDVAANAADYALEQVDFDDYHEEATEFGLFAPHMTVHALVDTAYAVSTASQYSVIDDTSIQGGGSLSVRAEADSDDAASFGFATNWMEVAFSIDETTDIRIDIDLRVIANAGVSVQLWEETPDGPVALFAEHLNTPASSMDMTHHGTLAAGQYRFRANVQGGAWADGGAVPLESSEGSYVAQLFLIDQICIADINADGMTDLADLGILLASYQLTDDGDLDGDGDTDLADLGILLADFDCGT
jgi:hypothetical protein